MTPVSPIPAGGGRPTSHSVLPDGRVRRVEDRDDLGGIAVSQDQGRRFTIAGPTSLVTGTGSLRQSQMASR